MKRNIYSLIITGNISLLSNINIIYCDNNNNNNNSSSTTSTVPSSSISKNNINKNSLKSDCHIPACNSTKDMLKLAKQQRDKMLINNSNNNHISSNNSSNSNNNNNDHGVDHDHEYEHNKEKIKHNPYKTGCPILREELGISTWKLIHTIAANYPESPSELDKQQVKQFFESLSYLYPCPHCAEDFQSSVASKPPRVSSREELSLWCCELHNEVNKKLGLPVFPCSLAELDIRWKFGREECWKDSDST